MPVSSNTQPMQISLVILFLPRKKLHAKQICVLTTLWNLALWTSQSSLQEGQAGIPIQAWYFMEATEAIASMSPVHCVGALEKL